jgi:glycosyltransferase involved in cell wall biosynthesis
MKTRVVVDARWLVGGIGTYTRHLLAGLGSNGNGFDVRAITHEENVKLVAQWCANVTVMNVPIYGLQEQFAIPRAAKGCDLLHVPHYNAPVLHRGPLLVSILDLIHISDPSYRQSFKSWLYARPMLNLAARKAEHIVTLSEYSKAQIVEQLGVAPSKVTTIYCGVNGQFRCTDRKEAYAAVSSALGIQEPYFLYVGNLKPHKNVSRLLQAFARLRQRRDMRHKLLIIGDDARWKPALVEECARLGIEAATLFVPYVAPKLLPNLYAGADLLVMPSRIEGFGLPVLEAMASGTPVVCSWAASLPEVAGGAALYFDPSSAEELADTIEKVLSSSDLQESLRTKGLERAKQFTWEESTRKHVELYQRLLGLN